MNVPMHNDDIALRINQLIRRSIPLAGQVMRIEVLALNDDSATLRLPCAENCNDKGSVFAGALYSALVLGGWSLAMAAGYRAGIVMPWAAVVASTCDYDCAVRVDAQVRAHYLTSPEIELGAHNWVEVESMLYLATDAQRPCARFTGRYAVGVMKPEASLDTTYVQPNVLP